ncbi:hypothetical protein BGZ95_004479 [Linnemannia exigua]|uniref:Septin-type G domain-containing protein n=1 Tax=Linnemannia exigua TaxID=604196 RepID=A0AAD4D2Y2_9FUNG|nr:hypothetical protein BGZ95_004479 [Linnemannia exigua]
MATPCLARLQHSLISTSFTAPRVATAAAAARAFSSSSPTLYSRTKATSTTTTTPGTTPGSGTNPWLKKKTATRGSSFVPPANSVLAYVGPYAASLRQCKSVAFVFGACGCIAVPSTLFLGNTEHLLAIMAGVASLSPSILLHALFRNEVTKIHVQGSVSTKTAAPTVTVSTKNALKLTFEKLNWRGVPLPSQVLSTNLFVQSENDKSVIWTTTSATNPVSPSPASSSSKQSPTAPVIPRKETYRVNKKMMRSNPSFSFVMDEIEHQSRLSHGKATTKQTNTDTVLSFMASTHYLLANPVAGQNIGYLRLAVVGDSAVGKTQFARQFVETLPEVLSHDWEPLKPRRDTNKDKDESEENMDTGEEEDEDEDDGDYVQTPALTERFSSTMMEIPWDNMDADDEVPARNLVFLDTPGYGSVIDARTNFALFMNHVSQTFEEKNSKISPFIEVTNNELMRSLVTGVGAHKFIDVCFYLIVHRLKPLDIEYMRTISEKVNVVPILAKVDTQSEQDVQQLKVNVLKTLREHGVSIYTFRIDYDRLIHMAETGQSGGPPFAVSNLPPKPSSQDPLDQIPFTHAMNELPLLRKLVLETQINNVRQFTVKKFINWRSKQMALQQQQQQQQQQQTRPTPTPFFPVLQSLQELAASTQTVA